MAEIVNISYLGSGTESQNYSQKDDSLITNSFIYTQFGDPNDSIDHCLIRYIMLVDILQVPVLIHLLVYLAL